MDSQLIMTKHIRKKSAKKSSRIATLRQAFPYFLGFIAIAALAFFGSKDKFDDKDYSLDMRAVAKNNFSVSADQAAELYIISEVATSMKTPTAPVIQTNYDSIASAATLASAMTSEKIDKPNVIDTSHLAVGVVEYTVQPNDTLASIANKYTESGVTEVMIRWSNKFKAGHQIAAGDKIYVPGRSGFVHVVKSGETITSLAKAYNSNAEEIIAANSLELNQNLAVGARILIPNGSLPESERPDYVAPRAVTRIIGTAISYSAQYSAGNRYAYGWCTWYAWNRRPDLPSNLGNASNWARAAAQAGFSVDRSPRVGDIFQNNSGYYGHVGYVTGVSADGSINVCDMNGISGWGREGCATFSKSKAAQNLYIHHK